MSNKDIRSNSKRNKKRLKKQRALSDASTLKLSETQLNQDMKQFKQLSKKSLIKQCKKYDIKYDGNKEKAIKAIYKSKKKYSKNKRTKNKKSKPPNTNSIHSNPPIKNKKQQKNFKKHSKRQKHKTKNQKQKNTKKSTNKIPQKIVKSSRNSQPILKTEILHPTLVKQPSLSQSSTTFETINDPGYTITMTTPKLMDKHSSHSSLSDHFAAATLSDIASQALAEIAEDKDDINLYKNMNDSMDMIYDNNIHVKSTSIIALTAQAPKMSYNIPNMRAWNTIADMKLALPIKVDIGQCKLFCGGIELHDDDTLAQLNITDTSKVKLLLSWRYFKADTNAVDTREIEHIHMDMVKEMKEINDFKIFNNLIDKILKLKYNIQLERSVKKILHEYCICLSGDRTYDRKWTKLHTICYDYQGNVNDVEKILKDNPNIYVDTWPHNGNDSPLRIAISNHLHNVDVIDLVEFLVLNGARRMVRQIVFNLKRNINDALYKDMDINIREQLIDILEPHIDEDPFKGDQYSKV